MRRKRCRNELAHAHRDWGATPSSEHSQEGPAAWQEVHSRATHLNCRSPATQSEGANLRAMQSSPIRKGQTPIYCAGFGREDRAGDGACGAPLPCVPFLPALLGDARSRRSQRSRRVRIPRAHKRPTLAHPIRTPSTESNPNGGRDVRTAWNEDDGCETSSPRRRRQFRARPMAPYAREEYLRQE